MKKNSRLKFEIQNLEKLTGRPRIWYQVLPVFFYFFFDGSPWYQMQPKKIWKIFWPQKRGFSTGLNTQKKIFLNFFLEFLGDFVPWY
jgi:hypothetical protein